MAGRCIILISKPGNAVGYVTNGDRENTVAVFADRAMADHYAQHNRLLQQMVFQIVELDAAMTV
jgi:hypothetical protein